MSILATSMTTQSMLGVVLALCAAGFMQGLTGFGFGMLGVALLPLLLELKDAQVLISMLSGVVCITTFAATWRHFHWRHGRGLVLGAIIGVPIGVWALLYFPAQIMMRLLGLVLLTFSIFQLWSGDRKTTAIPKRLSFPIGIVSGCLGGALNVGGPPAIAYVYSQPWTSEQTVCLLQAVFGITATLRVVLLIHGQLIHRQHLLLASLTLLPMVSATWAGSRLLRRVPHHTVKRYVFLFLLVMGVKYFVAGG